MLKCVSEPLTVTKHETEHILPYSTHLHRKQRVHINFLKQYIQFFFKKLNFIIF